MSGPCLSSGGTDRSFEPVRRQWLGELSPLQLPDTHTAYLLAPEDPHETSGFLQGNSQERFRVHLSFSEEKSRDHFLLTSRPRTYSVFVPEGTCSQLKGKSPCDSSLVRHGDLLVKKDSDHLHTTCMLKTPHEASSRAKIKLLIEMDSYT